MRRVHLEGGHGRHPGARARRHEARGLLVEVVQGVENLEANHRGGGGRVDDGVREVADEEGEHRLELREALEERRQRKALAREAPCAEVHRVLSPEESGARATSGKRIVRLV
eukprot:596462-Prorocentrum_minimum.AAC.1